MLRTSSDSQAADDKPPLSPPLRPQPAPLPLPLPLPLPPSAADISSPAAAEVLLSAAVAESPGDTVTVEDPPLLPPHPLPGRRPPAPPSGPSEPSGAIGTKTVSSQSLSPSEELSSGEGERDVVILAVSSSLSLSPDEPYGSNAAPPTLLYNQPDGDVRDAEFIRAEKLFFASPLTEAYEAPVYRSLQAVQRACAADYRSLCAPLVTAQSAFAQDAEETVDDDVWFPLDALSQLSQLSLWLPFRRRLSDTDSDAHTETEGLLSRSLSVARALYRGEALSLTQRPTHTVVPPSQRARTVAARTPALTHRVSAKPLTALSHNAAEKQTNTRTGRSLRERDGERGRERERDKKNEREKDSHKEKEKERERDSRRDAHRGRDRSPSPPPHHRAPPHTHTDELFYGALGFGASGDLCLSTHIAQRPHAVSESCVRSVDELYALRERYVHDAETQQGGGCLGVLSVVLLFFGGTLLCLRAVRARAHRAERERRAQAEKVLCALAADAELRQSLEEKLRLAVPPPAPHNAHTHANAHAVEENAWSVWRVGRSLLSLVLSLCVSFCVAVSSLILTGVVLRASGAERVNSEGEIERDAPLALVLFVALSLALAHVCLLRLVVRSLRTHGVCGSGENVSPSAPPLLAHSAVVNDRSLNAPTQRSGSDTGGDTTGSGGVRASERGPWSLSRLSSLPLSLSLFRRRDSEAHAHYTPLAGDELDASSHHNAYAPRALALGEREGEREMIAIGGTYAAAPHPVTTVYTSVPVVQQHYGGAPAMVAAVPLNSMSFV